jgi:hypothetical protein
VTTSRHSKNRNAIVRKHPTIDPTPPGALCLIAAQYYKIGLRGKVFRWHTEDEQWVRCTYYGVGDIRAARPLKDGQ